jgi:hypothetical protein
VPKCNHLLSQYDLLNSPATDKKKYPNGYDELYFFVYREMGISAPTLYGTMITQAQADSMWKHTDTDYWAHTALGCYLSPKPVDPPQLDPQTPPVEK